jgi:hypothetical protein
MRRLFCIAMLSLATAVALAAGTSKSAEAALILDQSHGTLPPPNAGGFINNGGIDIAQTFTVGITGILGRVEVAVTRLATTTGPLSVEIRPVIGGFPNPLNAPILADGLVFPADVPNGPTFGFVGVDLLSDNLVVTPGDVLAIVLRSDTAAGGYAWGYTAGDPYAGGHAFFRAHNPGTDPFLPGGGDQFFRTFVAPVTEPGSLALLALSLVALGFTRRYFDVRTGFTIAI